MIPIADENPTRTTPYVVYVLIAANVILFLLQVSGGGTGGALAGLTMVPYEITTGIDSPRNGPTLVPIWLTILTSMFLHGGLLHLGGNMLYLWIFGNNIEDALGHVKFLVFYLLCGVVAAMAHVISGPDSQIPTLGASGAIAGVLGAYLILFPGNRVINLVFVPPFFVTTVEIPAIIVLGIWFVIQFLGVGSAGMQTGGGVAYWAHIGGFIAGVILILLFGGRSLARPRRRRRDPYYRYYEQGPWYER